MRAIVRFLLALCRFFIWFSIRLTVAVIVPTILFFVGNFVELPLLGVLAVLAYAGIWLWFLRRWSRKSWKLDWQPSINAENLYAILGVPRNADPIQLRQALRRLSQKHHPDRAPPEEKPHEMARFVRLNKAYELLSDPETRYEYDWMIRCNDGRIPPFEEAYERLADVSKHPMFAIYDEWERTQKVIDWEEFEKQLLEPLNETVDGEPPLEEDIDARPGDYVQSPLENVETGSSECPACSWPFDRNARRPEHACCEQCGEELPRN